MKKSDEGYLPFVIFLLIIVVGASYGLYEVHRRYEDQYCKTTPLDRIDKERCNIQ